jgi:NADP-dependent 3-hydroxy acid dehydrogenase YdfG
LVTGATAGIGLAIANHLLSSSSQHLLILTGRKTDVLEDLEVKNPDRVISRAGDMSDLDGYVKLVLQGLHLDGRLDGLILNHGTFGSCLRIKDTKVEEDWESTFRINVSSCVALVSVYCGSIRKPPNY